MKKEHLKREQKGIGVAIQVWLTLVSIFLPFSSDHHP